MQAFHAYHLTKKEQEMLKEIHNLIKGLHAQEGLYLNLDDKFVECSYIHTLYETTKKMADLSKSLIASL